MRCLALLLLLAGLSGCTRVGYYSHLAQGQWQLWQARTPIDRLLADPQTDPALAEALREVLAARRFAVDSLALPDNGSYTRYADLGREAVVWNVFASPRYSLRPRETCHPLVGCLAYEGYFDRDRAERRAAGLAAEGWDVMVSPVPAYSTLGWFDDPVLNTMMGWRRSQLIGTVFHELAHQRLFIADDTAFNESYASFVERAGLHAWQARQGSVDPEDTLLRERRQAFIRLVMDARSALAARYAEGGDDADLAADKRATFEQLRADYAALRDAQWNGWTGYDAWFSQALNNAHLLPFGLYDQWVPAFAALFAQQGNDWSAFHAAAAALGALPASEREARLQQLLADAAYQ
jgi:predicted aminopeptidase